MYFSSDTTGYAVGATGNVRRTTNGGATWVAVTNGIGTTNALYAIASSNATNVVLVGAAGTVRRSTDGGLNWTTQTPGTSNDLRSLSVLGLSNEWVSGTNGTILKTTDQSVPFTSLTIDPTNPDGDGGWYVSTPAITLLPSKPGITYYSWTSALGPFSTYSTPLMGLEGNRTLSYYSVDTANISEAVNTVPIKTDVGPPSASALVTVTAVTTSTADIAWAAGTDSISGVSGYEVYLDGTAIPAASTSATGTVLTGLAPNAVHAITVVTVDVAGNRSPESLPAYAITNPLDTVPPTTTLTVSPSAPDGNSGWYVSTTERHPVLERTGHQLTTAGPRRPAHSRRT